MRLAFSLMLFLGAASPSSAEVSAILVGVSDYDDILGISDLTGPANDVVLLRDVLQRRHVEDIEIIADGVEGAKLPTRDAILRSFAQKALTTGPGDFVYIHLSGHGTQQRDQNGDESDGLDEVFLPSDTTFGEPGTGMIGNAIIDDEIGRAVDAIRATGASVWLVLDSCHSGSGLRAGDAVSTARFVDPSTLGVVVEVGATDIGIGTGSTLDLGEDAGGVIAFFAAQSSELARELPIADDGVVYGLFTAKLAARLDGGASQSFRQLFQATLRDMNDRSVPGGARMQTPLWDGDLIDAAVLGNASTTNLRRFEVRNDQILAGQLHGFRDGTLIGLVAQASDPEDALIGHAQLELTQATTAFLRPVSADCVPRIDMPCETAGTLPMGAAFGQIVAQPVYLIVRVSPALDLVTGNALSLDHPAQVALRDAIEETGLAVDPKDYDIEASWDGEALWFGPRTQVQTQAIGRRWTMSDEPLSLILTQMAKAELLDAVLSPLSSSTSILNPSPVNVDGFMTTVDLRNLLPPETDVSPIRECTYALSQAPQTAPLADAAQFKQCDTVGFQANGLIAGAWDVNRVHIDARYCIHNSYARVENATAATPLGQGMTLCSNCTDGYSAGDERLFIIISDATPNSPALNLTGQIENCVDPADGTRNARSANVGSFLDTLSQGRATRGALGQVGVSNIWVDSYRWTILPKEIALRPN